MGWAHSESVSEAAFACGRPLLFPAAGAGVPLSFLAVSQIAAHPRAAQLASSLQQVCQQKFGWIATHPDISVNERTLGVVMALMLRLLVSRLPCTPSDSHDLKDGWMVVRDRVAVNQPKPMSWEGFVLRTRSPKLLKPMDIFTP